MRRGERRLAMVAGISLGLLSLGGCAHDKPVVCNRNTGYLEAESVRPLLVPDDLSVPSDADSLRIPEQIPGEDASVENANGCLEQSPAFQNP
jgi:hypothetical protein